MNAPTSDDIVSKAVEIDKQTRARMSERGALGLPDALEAARWKHGLIDACFEHQAIFDAVFVYQLDPNEDSENYADTSILRPEVAKLRDKQQSSVGILISAGLQALDQLRSEGTDLGDYVQVIKLAPFRVVCGHIAGEEVALLHMRTGDIVGNKSLAARLRKGEVRVVDVGGSRMDHRYTSQSGISGEKPRVFVSEDQ